MNHNPMKFFSSTIAALADELDTRQAFLRNALHDSADLRSLIHDGLTGTNDLWLKTQLLAALDAVDSNVRNAI